MFPNMDVLTCRWGDDSRTGYHSEEPYCLHVNSRCMEQDALKWCKRPRSWWSSSGSEDPECPCLQCGHGMWVSVIQTHPRLKDREFQCPLLWHTLSNLHMLDRSSSLIQTLIIFEVILMTQCFAAVAFFRQASWQHRHPFGQDDFLAQSSNVGIQWSS